MRTITTTFEEVKDSIQVTKKCIKCGSKITKTLSRSQTINPWNDKSREQIHKENCVNLQKDKDFWESEEEICSKCRKEDIPIIEDNPLTDEQIKFIQAAQEKIYDLRQEELKIIEMVQNMVNDLYTINDSLIQTVFSDSGDLYFYVQDIRKDRKGVKGDTYSIYVKSLFKILES